MSKPRAHAYLVVPLLALTLFLVGCPKRPATTGAVAPAPAAPQAAPAPAPAARPGPGPPAPAPAPAPAPMPKPSEFAPNPNLKTVYFDFDKYDIRPNDAKTLDGNAAWLKANANNLVLIEGHCDERGTNEYNLALGEKRAKAAMNYLVAQGSPGQPHHDHLVRQGAARVHGEDRGLLGPEPARQLPDQGALTPVSAVVSAVRNDQGEPLAPLGFFRRPRSRRLRQRRGRSHAAGHGEDAEGHRRAEPGRAQEPWRDRDGR